MPSVFISYRRDDTAGEAGRLATDLAARFGRSNVFMDIDTIAPGVDFEARIAHALTECQVTFVLIGDRWLTVAGPDGRRRIEAEDDYVRKEIATALTRSDVTVVPVLVEGAEMPRPSELPPDIEALSKRNAIELTNQRWRYDLGQLCAIARRHDPWWSRLLESVRSRRTAAVAVAAAIGAAVVAIALAGGGGGGGGGPSDTAHGKRTILVPATVPPRIDECTRQLTIAVDGTVGPLECGGGRLNTLAWQYHAKDNPLVLELGRNATEGQVVDALCSDLRKGQNTTVPKEGQAYRLAELYYGWRFTLKPDVSQLSC